jgi:phosphatidate cytidylyltransferase
MILKNLKDRIYTSLILLTLIYLIFNFNFILVFSLLILGMYSLLEFFNLSKNMFKKKIYLFFSNSIFIIFIFIFCFMFFFFSHIMHLKILLFSLLFGCIASDIGGFVFGKIFKGPKLTKISPNKTISGAIGSLIFTCIIFSGLIFYYTNNFSYKIILISIITSIACQFGDLFFSLLKRKAKLKNTGNLFPGHGGVLDRLDGIFFGIPIGFLTLIIFY